MLNRAILPGEQRFSEECWINDILNKCHFDDRLWGYTIRVVEELRTRDPVVFTDGVLSLGADPYLPSRYIESVLRVFKQFACNIPRG